MHITTQSILILVCLVVLTACSGGSNPPNQSAPATAAVGATSTKPASSPTRSPVSAPLSDAGLDPTSGVPTANPQDASEASPIASNQPDGANSPAATSGPVTTATPLPPQATPEPAAPSTQAPTPSSPTPSASSASVAADIRGYGFPYELQVAVGTTVTWTNYDAVAHDVVASDESWTSVFLGQGESFSRTFTVTGQFAYICSIHPYMTGIIIVR